MAEEKYVVFQLEDTARGRAYPPDEPLDDGTFFVIRSSDVFGAPALYAYAHLIQTAVELDTQRRIFTDAERERLEGVAEYAVELAQQWQKRGDGRLPD